jgi:hypothetical protein
MRRRPLEPAFRGPCAAASADASQPNIRFAASRWPR